MDLDAVQTLAQMPYLGFQPAQENTKMSFDEACEMVRTMSSQKIKHAVIAQKLAERGYKDGKPVSMSMISQMAHWHQRKDKKQAVQDRKQEKRDARKADQSEALKLVNPNSEMIMMLKTVTKNKEMPAETRLKMVELLLKNA